MDPNVSTASKKQLPLFFKMLNYMGFRMVDFYKWLNNTARPEDYHLCVPGNWKQDK